MSTKLTERQEEGSIVRMRLKPSFRAFNLPDSVILRTFAIKLG